MIAQLLNKEFLLSQAEATRRGIEEMLADSRHRSRGPLKDFTSEELRELADALRGSLTAEGVDVDARRPKAPQVSPKEELAFVPRDPLLAAVQVAVEEYVEEKLPKQIETTEFKPGRRGAKKPVLTDRRLKGVQLDDAGPGRRRFGKFEVTHPKIFSDPAWIWSGTGFIWRAMRGRAPFNDHPAAPITMGNKARLVIVGDWGSGIPRALDVGELMKNAVAAGKADGREVHVIHLGDVYYAGWKKEYEKRFLPNWPVGKDEKDVGSFTLNGNHDMQSGGHGYFDTCLVDPRFDRQDKSSYFAMRNDHWQFLGLDTAHEDKGLREHQADWIRQQLEDQPKLRTVLMSHHQLFSAYEPGADGLRKRIAPILQTGRIDGWIWGHEHRCLVYGPHENVSFSTCVGHGGIPEYLITDNERNPDVPLVYENRAVYGDGDEPWDTFGFLTIDLDDANGVLTYTDEHGADHYTARVPDS